MREKLIEIIEYYADFLDWDRKEDMVDSIMEKCFATDNNVGGKWIPVSERLPPIWHNVLAYRKDGSIFIDWLDPHYEWYRGGHSLVTHWMPLPEPPKGE